MQVEVNKFWPGAVTEEDSYCTGVTLEPFDDLIRDDLFDNVNRLGVVHYVDQHPWDLVLHGIFFKSDVLTIARGELPEKRPIPKRHLPGPGTREVQSVTVHDNLV